MYFADALAPHTVFWMMTFGVRIVFIIIRVVFNVIHSFSRLSVYALVAPSVPNRNFVISAVMVVEASPKEPKSPTAKKGKKDEMAEKDKKGRCIKVRL